MAHVETGDRVWVPSETQVWALASVTSVSGTSVGVEYMRVPGDDGAVGRQSESVEVGSVAVTQFPVDEHGGLEDLVSLSSLHEGDILHNIRVRHALDAVYMFIGEILVAVNPYRRCALFDKKHEDLYLDRDPASRYAGTLASEPHVFAVVDRAYMNVVRDKKPQAFVITGESGAGKSATTSFILQYLTRAASAAAGEDNDDSDGGARGAADDAYDSDEDEFGEGAPLKERIVSATPILEAFGNARTVRNNNSSRFGKFIKIHFDNAGAIAGASFETYLLEKSRVVSQSATERNYHIFYQLLAGTFQAEKERFFLKDPSAYKYLNPGCYTIPGVNDADDFIEIKDAFIAIGMEPDELDAVFSIVSAVLLFGNIEFVPTGSDASTVTTPQPVQEISSLLGIPPEDLTKTLTTRRIVSRNSIYYKPRTPEDAAIAAGTAAKTLYSRLFDWIVAKVNVSVASGADPAATDAAAAAPADLSGPYCGILDIFGFEIFEHNSFEQFLINFVNERLQQLFVAHTFKLQLAEYEAEGLNVECIEFKDNQECLDLIQRKNFGVLSMLKDECKVPRGSDENLLTKMHDAYRGHPYYATPRKAANSAFVINHYAGPVTYEIDGFLHKNKDPPFAEFNELLAASASDLTAAIYAPLVAPAAAPSGGGGGSRGGRPGGRGGRAKGPAGLATQFLGSLNSLMDTLSQTVPHFIRCIKPNDEQKPGVFDANVTMRQIRCQGMLETIEMRKRAYPVWVPLPEFFARFGFLLDDPAAAAAAPVDAAKSILHTAETLAQIEESDASASAMQWQIGKTKVFLKDGLMTALEMVREERLGASVKKIQRMVRARLARNALAAATAARLADLEAARLLRAKLEKERLDVEARERERLEAERLERERLEAERRERERLEAERLERERLEREAFEAEQAAMLAAEQAEKDKAKREAMEAERLAKEKAAAEKAAAEAKEAAAAKAAAEAKEADALAKLNEQAEAAAAEEAARLAAAQAELKASVADASESQDPGRKTTQELREELGDAYIEGLPAELQGVALQPPPPPPPRSSSLKVATCEGYLMKKGGGGIRGAAWEQRFFALSPTELTYHAAKYKPAKGRIKIDDMVSVNVDTSQGKGNCIALATTFRTFYMYAGNEDTMDNWIVCLALAIKRADRMRAAARRKAAQARSELKKGYLQKQGGRRQNWLTRYFELSTTKLTYAPKKNSAHSSQILIRDITAVDQVDGLFRIDVVTAKRTYKLQARSEDELNDWLHAFDMALHPEKREAAARSSVAGPPRDAKTTELIINGITIDISDPNAVVKASTLSKRGGGKKNWSSRYVTLTASQITYAAKEGKAIKGAIQLSDVSAVDQNSDQGKPNTFQVETSYRVFYFQAASQEEMFAWLVALKKVIAVVASMAASSSAGASAARPGVGKEGFLTKRGDQRKNWNSRWFTITPTALTYAPKKNKPLKGSIPLAEISSAQICSDPAITKKKSNIFQVVTPSRTYFLQASSVDDMAAWIEAIQAASSSSVASSS